MWQGYSRELFQFEEDRFDNVPALIRFYVGGRRPISQASGAVIFHPITRTLPLRVITERHAEPKSSSSGGAAGERHSESNKRRSFSSAHTDTPQVINPLLRWEEVCWNVAYTYSAETHCMYTNRYVHELYFMHGRSGSQPANLENVGRRPSLQSAQSDSNLRTGTLNNHSTFIYMCLSPLTSNVHWMQLCHGCRRQSAVIPANVLSTGLSCGSCGALLSNPLSCFCQRSSYLWCVKFTCKCL